MEEAEDLLNQVVEWQEYGGFLRRDAPMRVYCDCDGWGNAVNLHNIKWPDGESENIEYIRKDVVEHIIAYSTDPQDALNKLRGL